MLEGGTTYLNHGRQAQERGWRPRAHCPLWLCRVGFAPCCPFVKRAPDLPPLPCSYGAALRLAVQAQRYFQVCFSSHTCP